MPSALHLSKVRIDDHAGHVREQVSVRVPRGQGIARVESASGELLTERDDVVSVTRLADAGQSLRYEVAFADGGSWEVSRKKGGCGCGK